MLQTGVFDMQAFEHLKTSKKTFLKWFILVRTVILGNTGHERLVDLKEAHV